jgi:alpha-beta hydrolase superfamily lysophospholipase
VAATIHRRRAGRWPPRWAAASGSTRHLGALHAVALLVLVLGGCSSGDWSPADARRCSNCQPVRCTHCRKVTFAAADGSVLGGILWTATPARPPSGPAVVVSNEYAAGQAGWGELPEHLRRHGYTVLTYDWRGLGASGGRFDPTKADQDLRAAVAYARQARPTQVVLVGASLGAMVTATQAAALHPVAIGLLSPARSFAGITVNDQILRQLGMPKLLVTSDQDKAAQEATSIFQAAAPPKQVMVYPGDAHGTQLLHGPHRADVLARFDAWLGRYAPASRT